MIPPLKDLRLRSINRWLKATHPTIPDAEIRSRAEAIDEQMLEAFDGMEDALQDAMMKKGTWGTGQGMTQFPMDRMTAWQEVCAEFLPATTDTITQD